MKQTTLKREVRCSGIGLHSGKKVDLVIKPAPADTGVVFFLKSNGARAKVVPGPGRVVGTGLATTLGDGALKVSTVEHLMASLVGLEIDNAIVEVMGEEIPILDGSASVFVYLLNSAGVRSLEHGRKVAKIARPLSFEHEGKRIQALPYDGLKIDYSIHFDHPRIGTQRFCFDSSPRTFASLIARARTFGFLKDVEYLQKNGLALGGTLENAVVFDEYGVVNPEGLRFEDELVRHKILDFMGDIAVGSHRLWGHFTVFCSGHDFNNKFMRYVFDNAEDCLEIVELGARAGRTRCRSDHARVHDGIAAWA